MKEKIIIVLLSPILLIGYNVSSLDSFDMIIIFRVWQFRESLNQSS